MSDTSPCIALVHLKFSIGACVQDVCALQAPFREDDAKADYSRTATTHALVRAKSQTRL